MHGCLTGEFDFCDGIQDQKLHTEAAADAQTDEVYTLPREVVSHCRHPLSQNLY